MAWFDTLHKIATIIIAGSSLYVSIHIFNTTKKNQSKDKSKDRRIQSLKVIILDHNLKYFYEFFESLSLVLDNLKNPSIKSDDVKDVLEDVGDLITELRIKFVDTLLAVDDSLYNDFIDKLDTLLEHLSNIVSDPGIKLSHEPKFNELIRNYITVSKTDLIKLLYNFEG